VVNTLDFLYKSKKKNPSPFTGRGWGWGFIGLLQEVY